jgi:hypothetical protein
MRLLDPLRIGLFASKVANRSIELGIDVNRLDPRCARLLHEIERDKFKELSPYEAASYFFAVTFSDLPRDCYLLPISSEDLAARATVLINGWVSKGKVRRQYAEASEKALIRQVFPDRLPEIRATLTALETVKKTFSKTEAYAQSALEAACDQAKENAKRNNQSIIHTLETRKWTVENMALSLIAAVCAEALRSGRNHIFRGALSGIGTGYLEVFSRTLEKMIASGFVSEDDARRDLAQVRKDILNVG